MKAIILKREGMKILLTTALFVFAVLNCVFHYCAFVISGEEDEREKRGR